MKPLVKILWRDTCGVCKWLEEAQALEWAERAYNDDHITVGYMLYKDARFVVVASTTDGEGGYNDVSMIPRANVKKIVRLEG